MLRSRPFNQRYTPPTPEEREARRAETTRREMAQVRPRAAVVGGATTGPVLKEPAPVRDKEYRMLVAQLPCFQCRIEGASQCAHPNTGKAKGRKTSDLLTFPLCHVGAKDCHARFDQYRLIPKAEMPEYERRAYHWTVRELLARGMWPARLALPDLRTFN